MEEPFTHTLLIHESINYYTNCVLYCHILYSIAFTYIHTQMCVYYIVLFHSDDSFHTKLLKICYKKKGSFHVCIYPNRALNRPLKSSFKTLHVELAVADNLVFFVHPLSLTLWCPFLCLCPNCCSKP